MLKVCIAFTFLCQPFAAAAQSNGTIIFVNDNTPNKNIGIYASDKYLGDGPPYTFVQPRAVKKFAIEGPTLFYTDRRPMQVLLALPGDSFLVRKGKPGRLDFVLLNGTARKNDARAMDGLIDSLGQFASEDAVDYILPITYRPAQDTLRLRQIRRANNNIEREGILHSYLLLRLAFVERLHRSKQVSDTFAAYFKDYFVFNYLSKSIWGLKYQAAPLDSFHFFAQTLTATDFLHKPSLLRVDAYRGFLLNYITYIIHKQYKANNSFYNQLMVANGLTMAPAIKNWLLLIATEKAFASGPPPDSLLQYFDAHCTDSGYRKRVADRVAFAQEAAGATGSEVLIDRGKRALRFADLLQAKKDSVVVVDFWATWCKPCLEEAPYFAALKKSMANQKVSFIAVSLDKDRAQWLNFYSKGGPPARSDHFLLLNNFASPLAKRYRIASIPRVVVIKEGKVLSLDAPPPSSPQLRKLIERHVGL
jgi:thiol-disulfide isomerase/thioredoxin